jgi:hypothetical protein
MNLEIRVACKFCVPLNMKKEIFDKLEEAYQEGYVSYAWVSEMDQNLSRESYVTCRWFSIRKTANSRWSRTHLCQGRIRAISIWLSYGMRPRSIQNLCIRGSQKVIKLQNTHFVGLCTLSTMIKKLPGLKWQPQCRAFSNDELLMPVLGY